MFLTRHPRKCFQSMIAQVENTENPDWSHWDPNEAGYVELEQFYDLVTAKHGKTTVIDSDEFAQNPEAGIRLLCERL